MAVPVSDSPKQGDTAAISAMKMNMTLATGSPPAPPAGSGLTTLLPKQGDTLETSLRKVNGLLVQGAGGGGTPPAETDPLSVHLTGGTMTGTLEINDPNASGAAELRVWDPTVVRGVILDAYPTIKLNGGASTVTIGNYSGWFYLTTDVLLTNGAPGVRLHVDPTTGDLIALADFGPNAGKSVNLTAGKWA